MKELDPDFIEALAALFGEYAEDAFGEKNVAKLREVWDRAVLTERKQVFEWMRADPQMSRCEDKEWLVQASWVIGNGTYRGKADLGVPLSWQEVDEVVTIDDDIRSQLKVIRVSIGKWEIFAGPPSDPETVAVVYAEENEEGAVTHRVELLNALRSQTQVRTYQTWEQCIHAVIAWVRMRANDAV